ncbi:MAG TPA: gliding motility-associated C-terminal domain-containing protein, partial [Flavobacterium sp.]|nr:gliding motility-associated C-terminal domain-containing protein [Flavobacterium sp.]
TLNAAGTATISVSPTTTGTINIVSVASSGNPSCVNPQTSSIPITVLPLPTASVTANPTTICENGTTTLTFTGTPNATVTYNINGGTNQTITLNAAGTATISVSPTTTGTINIVSVASSGTPSCVNPQTSSIPITIVEAPIAGVAPQPQVLCVTSSPIDLFLLLGNTAQTGGTWSPALASGTGIFNPAIDLSGSYIYTVTGNPLCPPAQVTVQITVNPIPNAGNDVVNYNICSNQNSIDLFTLLGSNAQTGGTWSPALASGTGVLNPAVDISATYTYTVVGIAPCVDDFATVEVIITQGPEAGNNNSITVCQNSPTQDLFLALGPNAQTGGTWSPVLSSGTGVFNPSIDLAGDYTYSLSGNDPCDNDEATITVIVNPIPDAGEDGSHIFCTNDSPQDLFNFLNGNPQTGGTWSPALASGTGVFNPLVDVATTYTYTVGGNLCDTDTANVIITIVQSPIAGADGQLTTCENVISLDLTTGLDGTQGNGTWTDDDNTGALTGNIFNPSIVGVGTYTFTYTVTGGSSPCTTDTSVVTVTVNPLPNAGDFVATSPICTSVGTFDLNTLLTGQDLGGNWLDSTNTIIVNPINVSALASGTYNYTYEVTNSCGDDEQLVQLEILPTPEVLTSNVTIAPICIGNNATIQFSGMQDGIYIVNYNVSGVNNITTQSETITITGGLGSFIIPSTSLSNIGTSTITFENIANTVTNCTATLVNVTSIIEVKPLLDILPNVITVANVCLGTDVTVVFTNATNFPDGTYQFNYSIPTGNPTTGNSGDVLITAGNGQFTIPASVFATVGSYTLTITGITSTAECSNPTVSSSVTFDVQATPNSGTFTGLISICPSTGVLDLNSLLENEDTGGEWKDSTGQVVNSPLTIINFSPATYSYTYTVTNSCASVSTTVQFTILPNPQIASFNISINPNCLGIDTIVTLNGMVDGIYTLSYDLSGSNTLAGQTATVTIAAGTGTFTIPSSNLTNIGTTVITITAILNTVSTCSNNVVNVSAQIQITPLSSIDSSNVSIANVCVGDDLTVQITNATNLVDGVYQFSYSIPNANPTTGNSGDVTITAGIGQFTIPAASFSTAGNYILTIVGITTTSGCANTTVSASTNFVIQPSLDITGATVSAQDTCVNFQSLVTISNANNLPDDSYTITYTLSGANAFTETITIPFVSGSAIFPLAQTNLTNAGATTITITDIISTTVTCGLNGATFPPYTFDVDELGAPTLVQEGNLFCEDENPTIANLSANILNGQTVIWYTSQTGGTAYAETDLLVHNTIYYAALVSQSGCEGATRLEVTVDLTICDDILIPDGFSPNDDTINDTFEIKNLPIVYPNFKLEIYNRYGNILYTGNKNTPLWDGTTTEKGLNVGGNVLPTGVYFYILYFNDGVKKPVQGRLYLSR